MPPRERPAVVIYGHLDHCTVDPIEIRLRTDTTIHIEKLILAQLFGQLFGAKLATHVVASGQDGKAKDWQKYERAAKEGNCKGKQSMTQAKCIPVDDKQKCIGAPCTCLLPFRDQPFRDQSFLQRQPASNGSKPPSTVGSSSDGQAAGRAAAATHGKRATSSDDVARKFGVSFRDSGRARATPSPRPPVALRGGEFGASFWAGNW